MRDTECLKLACKHVLSNCTAQGCIAEDKDLTLSLPLKDWQSNEDISLYIYTMDIPYWLLLLFLFLLHAKADWSPGG